MTGDAWVAREEVRLLVVDPRAREVEVARFAELPRFLGAGDVVVVNDAATIPGVLRGSTSCGAFVEARVIETEPLRAILFGPGDHTIRTEDRAPPPRVFAGDRLHFPGLIVRIANVSPISPRLVELTIDGGATVAELWRAIYRAGAPIQYAHRREPLPMWAVQTAYATRPWAAEMPSAGRPLTWEILLALRRRGAEVVALTHAAGPSATGDAALDAALPLPERYEIPEATARAVNAAHRRGGRVIAIGTTVVRALEANATAAPTASTKFGPTDRVLVEIECQAQEGLSPQVKVDLLNARGDVLRTLDAPALTDGRLRMTLPVASLANSTYVLRIEAAAGEQTAQQWVAFRIAR
ncbi:MAG TPA: S-adenosylmethionine:tRNA ribosyltransferase-isomerase [Kofleriaceae bacterium]|nr:S-adenosylmethionine:tRNA ribosyltransferase-isomerase [Kofleriaceae bacterium]